MSNMLRTIIAQLTTFVCQIAALLLLLLLMQQHPVVPLHTALQLQTLLARMRAAVLYHSDHPHYNTVSSAHHKPAIASFSSSSNKLLL
jgi:hypothetical protein